MPDRTLVVFDFDHTMIDENSDLYIRKLAPNGVIPEDIQSQYSSTGWTNYMGAIFAYLHKHKVTSQDYKSCLEEISLTPGMADLLHYLDNENFEVIIISDANSVFIDHILETTGLKHIVHTVYTNPAKFDADGCLNIQFYHKQDWCDLSTVNLCKGHIMESHVSQRKEAGIDFHRIAYIGDGSNDLCPGLRMKSCDVLFPRRGYSLLKKVIKLPKGELLAQVVPWDSALDIKRTFQSY